MGHIQINQKIIHHISYNQHRPKTFGLGGDFISPAKKPGSIEKRTTRVHNLFIHSGLRENAPPPLLEYLSSPIKAYGVRGLISYL